MANYEKKLFERQLAFDKQLKIDYVRSMRPSRNTNKENIISLSNDSNINKTVLWMKPVNASRKIQLVKTGLYNCDVQYERAEARIFSITVLNDFDSLVEFNEFYVFDVNANTYFKYNTKNIVFQPESLMGMIATTASGMLYYLNQNDFKNIDFTEGKVNLKMKQPSGKINTLKKLLEIFVIKE